MKREIKKSEIGKNHKEYHDMSKWCNDNGYHIVDDGEFYRVVKNPEKTKEEIEQIRRGLYMAEKDPITCQIVSLKDEEQTPDVLAEIEILKIKREKIVHKIRLENPYPSKE